MDSIRRIPADKDRCQGILRRNYRWNYLGDPAVSVHRSRLHWPKRPAFISRPFLLLVWD